MSFSMGTKKESSSQQSKTDPWAATIPQLNNFLAAIPGYKPVNATEKAAGKQLSDTYAAGNPYAGSIDHLTNDLFDSSSYSPMALSGYNDYKSRMTPVANGDNLDLSKNTYLQNLISQVGDDATKRVNAQFAGAGRDLSGANQQAVGRGVTQATLPVLFDQYNRELGRTDAAANGLYGAAGNTATTAQGLDDASAKLRAMGIDTGTAALDAKTWGPEQQIALQEQLKSLPFKNLQDIASVLFPAAKLGEQSSGTARGKTKSSGFSMGLKDIGGLLKGIGTL